MLAIYIIVALTTGLLTGFILHHSIKNKNLVYSTAFLVVLIALALTYFYIAPHYLAWQFGKNIRKQSSFINLVAEKSPDDFNRYLAKAKKNIIENGDPINEVYYASRLINTLLMKYGPIASDDSLYAYLKSDIEFDRKLFSIDPILVLFQEFPEKFADKIDLKKYSSNELKNEMLAAVEKVVESGIKHPHPLPNKQDITKAESIFRNILADITTKYGENNVKAALQHPENPAVDKKMAAEIIMAISEAIYAKGKETAGLLLRSSFLVSKIQTEQTDTDTTEE